MSGLDSELPPVVSHEEFTPLFKEIYPDLTLPELARLTRALTDLKRPTSEILAAYGHRDPEALEPIFDYLLALPLEIQNSLSEKQFHYGDLRALLPAAAVTDSARAFLIRCVDLRMSKSQIVEACELANELLAMDSNFEIPQNLERDQLLSFLREQRYPQATKKDTQRSQALKSLRWPIKSQVKWARQGDLTGLEIKVFASSPQEFRKVLSEFSEVAVEDLWKHP